MRSLFLRNKPGDGPPSRYEILLPILESEYNHTFVHDWRIRSYLGFSNSFDAIIGTTPDTFAYAWTLGRMSNTAVVYDFRDPYLGFYDREWPSQILLRLIGDRPDCLFTSMRAYEEEYGLDSSKCVYAPNAAPLSWTTIDSDPVTGRFCYVGKLSNQYNIELAIRAIHELQETHPPVHLQIAGDGPEKAHLESLAVELGISDCVEFLGILPHEDLPEVILSSQAGLALNPWVGKKEFEYLACARPCISNEVRTAAEDIDGIMTVSENVESVRQAMESIIYDTQHRRNLGQRGRGRVRDFYNWEKQADIWNEKLRSVI